MSDPARMRRLVVRFAPAWALVLLLVVWESGVVALRVPTFLLPAPSSIVERLLRDPGYIVDQVLYTGLEAAAGLGIAIAVALVMAVLITRSHLLERIVYPYLVLIQVTPIVAIAPLLIVWLGTGIEPKIGIAALIAFFPIVVNVTAGLKSASDQALELMRSLAASEPQVFRFVRIPFAVPFAFAAFRIAAPVSVIGAIVGEMVGSNQGLGFVVMRAKGVIDTPLLFVGILGSAFLGIGMFLLFVLLERLVVGPSRPSAR
jgi:ABC-type nitrate/sulfonate/bicarbonate transport system permease component